MSDTSAPVDTLIAEHEALLSYLLESGEASFHATLEGTVPKVFLLAAASWMETRVQEIMYEFFEENTRLPPQVIEFIRRNALERKFHTFFEWRERKPGKFFALFGDKMKAFAAKLYQEDAEYAAEYNAFLELGDLRNQLVHGNYASFTLEKTVAEVQTLYEAASKFVDRLPDLLRTHLGEGMALSGHEPSEGEPSPAQPDPPSTQEG